MLILTFAPLPIRRSAEWVWDLGAALGFWVLAGLTLQVLPCSEASQLRRHGRLALWLVGLGLAHALWFLAADPIIRFDLRAGGEVHLWAGTLALAVLAGMTVQARLPERLRFHRSYSQFRRGHRQAALLVIALAAMHVALSGFYAAGPGLVAVALPVVVAILRPRWGALSLASYLLGGAVAVLLFVGLRLP